MSERDLSHNSMVAVPIDEFITGNTIPIDVYIRIGENKFICLVKANSQAGMETLGSYQNKKIEYLWVHKDDRSKLSQIHVAIAGVIMNRKDLTGSQKTQVVSLAMKSVMDELGEMGISEELYKQTKKVTDITIQLVESHGDLTKIMEGLNSCGDDYLKHSMAVSAFSVMIGKAMGWEKQETVEKLALGGMLHDIGKKALSPELLTKAKSEMNYAEIKEYETHPFRGTEMLKQLSIIPEEVLAMVYQHHENSMAQGFPQKLRDFRINPFARICALANEFANLTIKTSTYLNPKSPLEAIYHIEHTMGQPFNKDAFKAFHEALTTGRLEKKKTA